MKKVLLISFFNSHNIGDILIAERLICILSPKYELKLCDTAGNITRGARLMAFKEENGGIKRILLKSSVLSSGIGYIRSLKDNCIKGILEASADCDAVVFAGGNMIMDLGLFPVTTRLMLNTVRQLKNRNKKVLFLFCGMGPFKSLGGFSNFLKTVKLTDYISVRDEYSLNLVKKALPGKDIEIWRDPVLLMKPDKKIGGGEAIGVNIYFGPDSSLKKKMKEAYTGLIVFLRKCEPNKRIYLFSSELTDINDIKAVKASFAGDNFVEVENISSKDGLLKLYAELGVVLATRMHTGITSAICGLPIIAISWQNKVYSFMNAIDAKNRCFTRQQFYKSPERVAICILNVLKDKEKVALVQNEILEKLKLETLDRIESFLKGK